MADEIVAVIVCPYGTGIAVTIREYDKSKLCPWCKCPYEEHIKDQNNE